MTWTWWAATDDKVRQLESKLGLSQHTPGDEERGSPDERHYVVLQNGINGDAGDWLNFVMDEVVRDRTVVVIVSRENERSKTNDGLDAAGRRLADLIESKVPVGARLSVVGHSMGGLVVRSALLDLNSRSTEVHERWQLQVFCTFSTPHLGTVSAPGFVSMAARKINYVSALLLKAMVRQWGNCFPPKREPYSRDLIVACCLVLLRGRTTSLFRCSRLSW